MGVYTVTIHELQMNNFDFGLDDYTIFDEEYREVLNNTILEYWKFREIGFVNPYKFRDRLIQRLDLVMRNKYNQLYKEKQREFNPLYNIEIIETFKANQNSNVVNGNTNIADSSNLGLTSQFPSEEMTEDKLTDNLYVDNASKSNGKTTTTDNGNTTDNTNQSYDKTTVGSSAGLPFSKAMLQFKQYLDKFMLDELVCKELSDLFMNIYDKDIIE